MSDLARPAITLPEIEEPLDEESLIEDEPLIEDELLVEDVSIDGMCGVY